MTATLETLRADFVRLANEEWDLGGRIRRWLLLRYIEHKCHQAAYFCGPTQELRSAGRLYRIARSDGLKAAMLYKLSDGAIDPRVKP